MSRPVPSDVAAAKRSGADSEVDGRVRVAILAGGSGTRFWPLSTPDRPKQLLPLGSERPLIVDTLERVEGLVPRDRIRVLAGPDLVESARAVTGLPASAFLVEAQARGTGPALARAAWAFAQEDPEAVVVSVHSDHLIRPPAAFHRTIGHAVQVARRHDALVTLAVPPDRPETGYGYLRLGAALGAPAGATAHRVDAFVEKPGPERAREFVRRGDRWNSGIFVWSAATFLAEVERHAPGIARAMERLEAGDPDGFFAAAEGISVDEAVLERSARVACVDATFRWDDMGSWEAWARNRVSDSEGNATEGDADAVESRDNVVLAASGRVVLLGVENHLVVRTPDVTLVAARGALPRLKELLERLPERPRDSGGAPSDEAEP